MYKWLIFTITAVFLCGCEQSKFSPPAAGPAADGPTLVADQPKNNAQSPDPKKSNVKHHSKKIVTQQAPQPEPVPTPAPPPPPEVQAAVEQPALQAPPKDEPKQTAGPFVVGISTQFRSADQLFDRGLGNAIRDATICANFGFIPNAGSSGSKCFLVYSDGSVKAATYYNRADAHTYIEQLNSKYAEEQKAEKAKKDKRRKSKE